MDKKQKEALVLALLEKGKTYRDIARKAGVSPNTIKAIANKSGLDETTSILSRAFELYAQLKTPLQVAIELNLKAEDAIHYYHQYFALLGITEFTKAYLQVKNNPWPFTNLVKLTQNSGMGDAEVAEVLKIANGSLPRVKLEYDRIRYECNSLEAELNAMKAELNSRKAELSNAAGIYQQFCDSTLKLKNREDELKQSISRLEAREAELQTRLNMTLSEFQECTPDNKRIIDTGQLSFPNLTFDDITFQEFPKPKES
jgi:transcriptional regulator with XRE-family HTH domain